ncbi:CYTH domain-containing protein [Neobacillus rhizosphaerae]|uniref:CYTH domain-containing protein n=1 Tax=Neobacillus rhizosphaerae TaxID=2880965 RepID=UPI003D2A2412
MSQNIEIEFKNMLTESEYKRLLNELEIDQTQIFSQENHYFDTPRFSLKEAGSALRIRKKKHHFEMTLKQPATVGLLETNQILSEEEVTMALQSGKLPTGVIQQLIEANGIPFSKIEYFGHLLTNRVEIPYKKGLLVLDHSTYLNKEDYELEYEVEDYKEGQLIFQEFLSYHKIPERKTENKIRRFYMQKYKMNEL